jgi:hypothetical protein
MSCPVCDHLDRARAGRDGDFVAALPSSSVFLADEQVDRGYCLLIMHVHARRAEEPWETAAGALDNNGSRGRSSEATAEPPLIAPLATAAR